jgi:hypothetical protein
VEEGRSGRHRRPKERKALRFGRPHQSRPKTYTLNIVEGVTKGERFEARDVQLSAQVGGEYQSKEIKEDIHPSPVIEAAKAKRFVSTALKLSVLIGPEATNAFLQLDEDMQRVATVESARGIVTQQEENLFRVESSHGIVTRQEEDLVGVDEQHDVVTKEEMNVVGVAGASKLGLVGESEGEVVRQDSLRVALVGPNNEKIPLEAPENACGRNRTRGS